MPDDLLRVDGLPVDDRRDLAVRAAGVKTNAAAVCMASHTDRALVGSREICFAADNDLKRTFKHIKLKACVKFARPALTVCVPDLRGNGIVALKIDPEAASRPEQHFHQPLGKSHIGGGEFLLTQTGLIDGDLAVIALDRNSEGAGRFRKISPRPNAERNEAWVECRYVFNRICNI